MTKVAKSQFCKRLLSYAQFATKMKEIRTRKHLTQEQLAELAGISASAIRNYESLASLPKRPHLESLAAALDVRPEALRIYDFGVGDSVTFNALFQLADIYGLMPSVFENKASFVARNDFMSSFLYEWTTCYTELCDGGMDLEDYKRWQDCFAQDFMPSDFLERYELADGDYRLIEPYQLIRFSQTLKGLRKERHLSQDELASLVGTTGVVIRAYEQQKRLPKAAQIKEFAKVFGITEGALIFYDYGSPNQAGHALFQLADKYGLYPCYGEHGCHLTVGLNTPVFLITFIEQWQEAYMRWAEDDDHAYKSWQQHYELLDAHSPVNRKSPRVQEHCMSQDAETLLVENKNLKRAIRKLEQRNRQLEEMRKRLLDILY